MNPLAHILTDSAPWREVSQILDAAYGELPPSTWRPTVPIVDPHNRGDQQYLEGIFWEILKDHVREANAALIVRHSSGEWPDLSPQAVSQLHLIHKRSLYFLASICGVDGPAPPTAVRFPDGSPSDVALWVVTMWWTSTGFPSYLAELARRSSRLPYDVEEI
jgi:hypothetical protein